MSIIKLKIFAIDTLSIIKKLDKDTMLYKITPIFN